MNKLPLSKKVINEAVKQSALEIIGKEGLKNNGTATAMHRIIFVAAVEWAMKTMLQLHDSPGDPAHRLITTERLTHLVRGYDAEHDLQYTKQQLAVCGILLVAEGTELEPLLKDATWPIKGYPDKRGKLDRVRQRVIGAGLIAGQIDLDIATAKTPAESEVANV